MPAPAEERIRLFVALPVPPEIREGLMTLRDRLAAADTAHAFRMVSLEGLHITLKFIGEIEVSWLPNIKDRLSQVLEGRPPLELAVRGVGAFPKPERPRIIWAGIAGDTEPLAELRKDVDRKMKKYKIKTESYGHTPHITLARRINKRVPEGADVFVPLLEELKAVELGGWTAGTVILYQSQLQPTGAIYTPLATFPLRRPPPVRRIFTP